MIADLKPYPAYRESGLPWLGKVPKHWDVKRLKLLLREVDCRSSTGKEQLLRVSQYTGVTQRKSMDGTDSPDSRAASLVGYKRVMPNDLVINIMLAWNGSMGVSRYEGIASPAYCVYRFNSGALPLYYHELLRIPLYKGRIKAASTGVVESRLRLYSDDLGCIEAILPPPDEQVSIMRFLNWANGQLEKAIRAKRKVITLLNEQKQVIIHRAVTRGLDPSEPLKPSGISWIGEMPVHWNVVTVGSVLSLIQTGPFGSQLHSHEYVAGGTPVINPSHMENGRIVASREIAIGENKLCELSRHKLYGGDIIAARRGEIGRCALVTSVEVGWICGTGSVLLRCKSSMVLPVYFQRLFSSQGISDELNLSSIGATMPNLNSGMIARLRIPLPPVDEQERIVRFIECQNKVCDTAISRFEREIELLREYRTRLVADVVTGKLDVREAAAKLPDEVQALEFEDDLVALEEDADSSL